MDEAEARALLGVGPTASLSDATAAYRRLAKLVHPDRVRDLDAEQQATATETMARLNAALDTLRSTGASQHAATPDAGPQTAREPGPQPDQPRNPPPSGPRPPADASRPSPPPPQPPRPSHRWRVVAVLVVLLVAGVWYALSSSRGSPTSVAADEPTVLPSTEATSAASSPSVVPSATTTEPSPVPSPVTPSPAASKPIAAQPSSPRPTKAWPPKGFEVWDDGLAYRWATAATCPTNTGGGCWAIDVISRDGCRYDEYLSLDIFDTSGQQVGNTYELKGRQRAGSPTRFVLPDTSFGGVGDTAQIATLTCS